MAKTIKQPKSIIGWREWCAFPDLQLPGILAKIDTGAKTSALHAFNICASDKGDDWIKFSVHPVQRRKQPVIVCEARCLDMRAVTSSNGKTENRPVVLTTLRIGPHHFEAEVTLTNRDQMGFRMLIGRQSLNRRFIVDPSLSYCCGDQDERLLYPKGA
ncbi:ATP-dependent zinc protease family protein [Congregibacter sp.]|uniref:ATP-dependent zinc protease family protein n=1 Tax=Congregibacter sp. TaxID=2744308 RepID=UPI003F6D6C35